MKKFLISSLSCVLTITSVTTTASVGFAQEAGRTSQMEIQARDMQRQSEIKALEAKFRNDSAAAFESRLVRVKKDLHEALLMRYAGEAEVYIDSLVQIIESDQFNEETLNTITVQYKGWSAEQRYVFREVLVSSYGVMTKTAAVSGSVAVGTLALITVIAVVTDVYSTPNTFLYNNADKMLASVKYLMGATAVAGIIMALTMHKYGGETNQILKNIEASLKSEQEVTLDQLAKEYMMKQVGAVTTP